MRLRYCLLASVVPALLVLAAACSDDVKTVFPTSIASPGTPGVGGSPATAGGGGEFGESPKLGGNILTVAPAWAARVTQASTRTIDARSPRGVCASVTFDGLPENAQWFRMAVDGQEVTAKLTWLVKSTTDPKDGTVCYAPEQGLTVGKHQAAISVQNPRNLQEPTKQIVGWAFEVTP